MARSLMVWVLLVLGVVTAVAMLGAGPLVRVIAPASPTTPNCWR
jgi:hypothetical protein